VRIVTFLQYNATCKILTGKNSAMCIVLVQVTHLLDAVPTSFKGPTSVRVLKMLALFKIRITIGNLRQQEFKYFYGVGGRLQNIWSHSVCMFLHNVFICFV